MHSASSKPEHNNQINKEAVLRDRSYYSGRYVPTSESVPPENSREVENDS